MSAAWILQTLTSAALLGLAALATERAGGWFSIPRRGAWAAAMAASLLLPALSLTAPAFLPDLGILPDSRRTAHLGSGALGWLGVGSAGHAVPEAGAIGPAAIDLATILSLGWLGLSVLTLAVLLWSYRRLREASEGAEELVVEGMRVRVADGLGPAVLGLRRPLVLLPRWVLQAPDEERRLILLHEREHLASRDGWLLFAAALALAAMPWCLPLWWQHRRLRLAVETDCDARA